MPCYANVVEISLGQQGCFLLKRELERYFVKTEAAVPALLTIKNWAESERPKLAQILENIKRLNAAGAPCDASMVGTAGSQTRVCRLRDRKENSFRQAELYGIDEGIEQLYAQITRINQMKRGEKIYG